MDRRAFLTGGGALVAGATAGCLDTVPVLGDDSAINTGSPEAVVESYVRSVITAGEPSPDTATTVFHSTTVANTPIGDEPDQGQGQGGPDFDIEIALLEMQGPALRESELSVAQLRATAQSWGVRGAAREFTPPEGFIADLAAGETALVDVRYTIEQTFGSEQTDGEQTTEVTLGERAITAVEDGDWQIVATIPADGPGGS